MRKGMPDKVLETMAEVKAEIVSSGNVKELEYYLYSEIRFEKMARSILELIPEGARILNIGSHFLHSSMILSKLGYQITGVDLSTFWGVDFVQKRAKTYNIESIVEDDLETFKSVAGIEDTYDFVIFSEILEHITFNPVNFWSRVYSLLRTDATIYLTTPNSLALPTILRAFKDLVLFNGIGIKVEDILSQVTYGHHWKEYSKKEIRKYFKLLSNDFAVNFSHFTYHKYDGSGFRPWLWHQFTVLGHRLYFFSPALEVIVTLKKKEGFKAKSPTYH